MFAHPVRFGHRHRVVRQLLVWALVVALPINSVSHRLVQVLGAVHRHSTVAPLVSETPLPEALPLETEPAHEHTHGEAAHAHLHAHAHMMFERHFHQPSDDSVIVLGAKEADQDAAGHAAGATDHAGVHWLPQTSISPSWPPVALGEAWGQRATSAWRSHISAPPEHPPRC